MLLSDTQIFYQCVKNGLKKIDLYFYSECRNQKHIIYNI